MNTYEWVSGGIAPLIYLGTRWRWLVSFTLQPLYRRRSSPRYPLKKRLSGPQSHSGLCGESKKIPFNVPTENLTPVIQSLA
jgi:hypothetical protein